MGVVLNRTQVLDPNAPAFFGSTIPWANGKPTHHGLYGEKDAVDQSLWDKTYTHADSSTTLQGTPEGGFLEEILRDGSVVTVSFSPYGLSFTVNDESRFAQTLRTIICAFARYLGWTARENEIYVRCQYADNVNMRALGQLAQGSFSDPRFCNFIVPIR